MGIEPSWAASSGATGIDNVRVELRILGYDQWLVLLPMRLHPRPHFDDLVGKRSHVVVVGKTIDARLAALLFVSAALPHRQAGIRAHGYLGNRVGLPEMVSLG
jgi:hypothetical protein